MLGGAAALGACVIGIPAALGIVRGRLPGRTLISSIFRAPLQIPAIVTGIAFLQMYYLIGDATGLYFQGTFLGLYTWDIFSWLHALCCRHRDRNSAAVRHEAGGSRIQSWRQPLEHIPKSVTLPVIMPGVYAGALYAFMVSFGDVPDIYLSYCTGICNLSHRIVLRTGK